jgi:hypothetical protein
MADGLEKIGSALKQNQTDLLLLLASAATAENKFKAIGEAVRDIAVWRLIGPLGIVAGTAVGILGTFRTLVRETGSLEAALRRLSTIQGLRNQFAGIIGGAAQARQRVAELLQFSDQFGQSLERVGRGGRALEVLTRGAFATGRALQLVGDTATETGNQFDSTASAVGEFYGALRDGQPIGAATENLRAMGVISSSAADRIRTLQESGAGLSQIWGVAVSELEKNTGAMDRHRDSVDAVGSRYQRAKEVMAEKFGAPFTSAELESTKAATEILDRLSPVAGRLANSMASIANPVSDLKTRFAAWFLDLKGAPTAIESTVRGVASLAGGLLLLGTAVGSAKLLSALGSAMSFAKGLGQAGDATARIGKAGGLLAQAFGQLKNGEVGAAAMTARLGAMEGASGLAAKALQGIVSVIARFGPWGAIIAGLTLAVGALWTKYEKWNEAEQAILKMRGAHLQTLAAINQQIAALRTLDDQMSLLASTANEYAQAMKNAQEARAHGDNRKATEFENEANDFLGKEARIKATRVGAGAAEMEALRRESRIELEKRQAEFDRKMANASPEQRAVLRQGRIAEEEQKLSEGKRLIGARLETNRALQPIDFDINSRKSVIGPDFNPEEAQKRLQQLQRKFPGLLVSGGNSQISTAEQHLSKEQKAEFETLQENIRLHKEIVELESKREEILTQSKSEVMRELAGLDKTEQERPLTPDEQKRRADLITKQEDLETGYDRRAAGILQMQSEGDIETRQRDAEKRQLAVESRIVAIPASIRGVDRLGEETKIRLQGIDAEISDELGHTRDRAKLSNLANQRTQLELSFREQARESLVAGLGVFRDVQIGEARARGDSVEAQRLENLSRFSDHYEQLRRTMGDKQAKDLAMRLTNAEIAQQNRSNPADVVSSIQRIGGGGYVGTGTDSVSIAKQQLEIARDSEKLLAQLVDKIENITLKFSR